MFAFLLFVLLSKLSDNHKQNELEQVKEGQKKLKISKINALINKINEKASYYHSLGKESFKFCKSNPIGCGYL
jgi:hypothetical protein